MASRIEGLAVLEQRLASYDTHLKEQLEQRLERDVQKLQEDAASLMPVDTGKGRETVLLEEAIKREKGRGAGGGMRWTFGFITENMRRLAYYLFFVEFGTKGYEPGQVRTSGKDKKGRLRQQRIKKRIPARRAQPWFRPSAARFLVRFQQDRAFAHVHALALELAKGGRAAAAEAPQTAEASED